MKKRQPRNSEPEPVSPAALVQQEREILREFQQLVTERVQAEADAERTFNQQKQAIQNLLQQIARDYKNAENG